MFGFGKVKTQEEKVLKALGNKRLTTAQVSEKTDLSKDQVSKMMYKLRYKGKVDYAYNEDAVRVYYKLG